MLNLVVWFVLSSFLDNCYHIQWKHHQTKYFCSSLLLFNVNKSLKDNNSNNKCSEYFVVDNKMFMGTVTIIAYVDLYVMYSNNKQVKKND